LAHARRASLVEDLSLLGRQDLVELGLGLPFKLRDLFHLLVGQVQSLGHEAREQMEPTTRSTRTARAPGMVRGRRAAGTATLVIPGTRRTAWRALLRARSQGKGGNRQDAEDRKKR
jgi:hypothetical protein